MLLRQMSPLMAALEVCSMYVDNVSQRDIYGRLEDKYVK